MLRKLILFFLCVIGVAPAQNYGAYTGFCTSGAVPAVTNGLYSANTLQSSYGACTVNVYQTNTLNPISLYSDSTGTVLSNPFTAGIDGKIQFFAVPGTIVDITMSGGIGGVGGFGIPSPYTLSSQLVGGAIVNLCSTANNLAYYPASGYSVSCAAGITTPSAGVLNLTTLNGNVVGNLTGNVTGNLTGNVTGNVNGTLTGNVIGNVTGNLDGNVTGNVTGNLTGNVVGNLTGTVTGHSTLDLPLTGGTLTGALVGPIINGVVNSADFSGADIGAQINAAVAFCVGLGVVCTIEVPQSGGTISTPPALPIGFTLRFNPQGRYNLSTHWVMNHRGVTYQFNGAQFTYTLNDGGVAFYVGKGITGVVNVTGAGVDWVSGSQFSTIDVGDEFFVYSSGTLYAANVAAVNSATHISLLSSIGTFGGASYAVEQNVSNSLGPYPGRNVSISDLVVNDPLSSTAADVALEIELADEVTINNFTANTFFDGNCANWYGAITANVYGLHCNSDKNGLMLDQNHIGGFFASTSNANRFFGIDIVGSQSTSGNCMVLVNANQNHFYGLHLEGNFSHVCAHFITAGFNNVEIADVESNGDNTAGSADFLLEASTQSNVLHGGSLTSVYNGGGSGNGTQIGISIASGSETNALRDILFALSYATSYTFNGGTSGFTENLTPAPASIGNAVPAFNVDNFGNLGVPEVIIGSGTNTVYRCLTSGTLPAGALTITAGNCGTSAITGLFTK